MNITLETQIQSLGNEPYEVFGFKNEQELEAALKPLMQEIPSTPSTINN